MDPELPPAIRRVLVPAETRFDAETAPTDRPSFGWRSTGDS